MLSSTQRIETGTLAPHLSQSVVIPHLTAMIPVLLDLGDISLELNRLMRKKLNWGRDYEDTAAMVSNRIGSKLQWRKKRLIRDVSCNS